MKTIIVKPLHNGYQISEDDKGIEVSEFDLQLYDEGRLEWNEELTQLVQSDRWVKVEKVRRKFNINREIHSLKSWLSANDYKVNKILLGELDRNSVEAQTYMSERRNAIARINQLQFELRQLGA